MDFLIKQKGREKNPCKAPTRLGTILLIPFGASSALFSAPENGNLLIAGELWEQALAVLESMTTFQLSLDVITFNLAITSCANSTQKSMALQVLQRMLGLLIFYFPSHAPDKNDVLSRPSEGMIDIHKEFTFPWYFWALEGWLYSLPLEWLPFCCESLSTH